MHPGTPLFLRNDPVAACCEFVANLYQTSTRKRNTDTIRTGIPGLQATNTNFDTSLLEPTLVTE
jgi:hypothetical protein